jgi:hypothetical protein
VAQITIALHQEIANVLLLIECVLKVGFLTGLIVVPIVLIGYESFGKRRRP